MEAQLAAVGPVQQGPAPAPSPAQAGGPVAAQPLKAPPGGCAAAAPAQIHVEAFHVGADSPHAPRLPAAARGAGSSAASETAGMHGCFCAAFRACSCGTRPAADAGPARPPGGPRSSRARADAASRKAAAAEALAAPVSPVVAGLIKQGSYLPANPPPELLPTISSLSGGGGAGVPRQPSLAFSARSAPGSGPYPGSPRLLSIDGRPSGAVPPLSPLGAPAAGPGAAPARVSSDLESYRSVTPAPGAPGQQPPAEQPQPQPQETALVQAAAGALAEAALDEPREPAPPPPGHEEHEWMLEPPTEAATVGLMGRLAEAGRCDERREEGALAAQRPGVPPPTCCIRCLDLSHARLGPAGAAALARAAAAFPRLQSLVLAHCDVGGGGAEEVCAAGAKAWPGLEELDLSLGCQYGGCGARGAAAIVAAAPAWPLLAVLNLRGNRIGDAGAASLAAALPAWPALETLTLSYNELGPEGAAALGGAAARCPALKVLDLGGNPDLGPAGVASLAAAAAPGWRQLQLLALSGSAGGDAGAAALAAAGAAGAWLALRVLLLDEAGLGPVGARALGRAAASGAWPGLQLLDLGHNPLGDEGVSGLMRKAAGGSRAAAAAAKRQQPPRGGAAAGGAWPALRQLRLPATLLFAAGAGALADLAPALWPALEDLDLSENPLLGEGGLRALALGSGSLPGDDGGGEREREREAAAPPAPVGGAGAGAAPPPCRWPALRTLQLARTGLDGAAAAALVAGGARWLALEVLVLSNNSLDDTAASALAAAAAPALPRLRRLVAARDPDRIGPVLSHVAAAALAAAPRPAFAELEELDLSGQCIGAAGACALSEAAPRWVALRTLALDGNGLGDDGASALAAAAVVRAWRELRCLRLRGCEVGDAGAEALVSAGAGWPWLQELDLSHNHIGRAGVLALARRGGCWSDLRALKLAHNAPPPPAAGGPPPADADALLALAEAGGANWPELEVLTLCGGWRKGAGGGRGRGGGGGGGAAAPVSRHSSGGVERTASSGGSSSSGPPGRAASDSDAGSPSFKRADAGVAAAPLLALDAPRHLQRLSGGPGGRPARPHGAPQPQPHPSHSLDGGAGGGGPGPADGGADAEDAAGALLSPEARAALAEGPAPAACAFLEAAGQAWPELRALELPALGRHTLFDSDHERLEEMARRVAPRLSAVNFRRHLHHI
ncbi:hypothetical protein Rsub_00297 [Raphidocelis subcapitata]|uniref:Uncharacterized protein n=1 Tax=Raphidocelis subcapitata TaxID=307507 RepID=A0A2V0NJZ5_9CHLO|nr:hypothetical protein Rsub_00297 [Raphidocelis subcapitata]|eukprot:GBF87586.1 hypothetical protein Rsub_00297 [Raphidocelis subcapitata]